MKAFQQRFVLLFLAAFVSIAAAHSMENDSMEMKMMKPTHQFGYISPGFSWIDFGQLNNFLKSSGFSAFPEQAWTLSLGGYKDYRRLVMESAIMFRIWGDNVNGPVRVTLCAGEIVWNMGFNSLPPEWPVSLYPYLGLGVGGNSIYFRDNSKTLASLLASTEPNSFIGQLTPLLNLGLGSNYVLASKDGDKGLAIGLRIGYLFDLYINKSWYSDGIRVSDMPSILQNGAYIRLVLGGWGGHHKHMHMHE
ncbi:MAG TPA: hypothetical protein VLX68_14605 [Chitinivibrionales bacterium]|nr:hypothetical protein [Chitinivibrionales bacterium]